MALAAAAATLPVGATGAVCSEPELLVRGTVSTVGGPAPALCICARNPSNTTQHLWGRIN